MSQVSNIGSIKLKAGGTLPSVNVAYAAYGQLNSEGNNAILVTHGFTSGHTMIEAGHLVAEGSWATLVGSGQILDTDRYFVICTNMLGSAFGTTGPRDINPATGKPWGPDFPDIILDDIVEVQYRLLRAMGVKHLRAVIGTSYGGLQALQWALDHPQMVDAIGVVSSNFSSPSGLNKEVQQAKFANSPQWHGGWYYDKGGMYETLLEMRIQTLQSYGLDRLYADRYSDPQQIQDAMEKSSRQWASEFDANSMAVLAGAASKFDARDRLSEIKARVLLVQCTTDKVFPANEESERMLSRVPALTRYVRLDSPYGHMGAGVELTKWQAHITWLLGDRF